MSSGRALITGAFVAVPLARVNEHPMGPHPASSYESELKQHSSTFGGLADRRSLGARHLLLRRVLLPSQQPRRSEVRPYSPERSGD